MNKLNSAMSANPDLVPVRYCVTAVIDLLGFASHLEVGGADVRTTIGQEAITRLQILEQAIRLMEEERQKRAQEYPVQPLFYRRINDCILLVADLPNYLLPHTGDTVRSGMTSEHSSKRILALKTTRTTKNFSAQYKAKRSRRSVI